ncbi:endo alpha-1,4 polygalactosaminidase [Aspergillus ibericus CBS 121593]|uniref:alpha-galactosidase n=1 Tax=Aspergillus ibericus CBS 121593 TaxID=1448316 RepID=A0A395GR06_9EURO|nr:hypothetical protein BO80DRAFT_199187 [Aspergillus ibericus CBS 121593]RAK97157.1 hypothetical protein BO80DRAFT_199187 [Aspergillus ibericus CBS 121593]
MYTLTLLLIIFSLLTSTTAIWQPAVGTTWQIILTEPLSPHAIKPDYLVYDIDLFINNKSTIDRLHTLNHKAICYLSAGSFERNRPDSDQFLDSDKGNPLDDWRNERWLDIRSANVRRIMSARLDRAAAMGCDGVDPDNVDGYAAESGFELSKENAVEYVNWLAGEAHTRGLAIGLKNANGMIRQVLRNMQWSVNEECARLAECGAYTAFGKAGKPVFHIEYPKGSSSDQSPVGEEERREACVFRDSRLFSTVMKNLVLDSWIQGC